MNLASKATTRLVTNVELVGSESIAVGQCILVKHDDSEDQKIDIAAQWKAKVLEVRALDSEHVYIRVAWLNRPEDLSTGRKPYHGKNELIPTNQMDIIDAMAVNGSSDVVQWDEKDDDTPLMTEVIITLLILRYSLVLTSLRTNSSGDKLSTSQTQKHSQYVLLKARSLKWKTKLTRTGTAINLYRLQTTESRRDDPPMRQQGLQKMATC